VPAYPERDRAEIAIVTIDDEEAVGARGQLATHSQIAQHDFETDVWSDAHRVGVHEAARAVFRIREHFAQSLAIALVHRAQHLHGDGLGQLAHEIGQIVELHAFGGGDQLFGFHLLDEFVANAFAELEQHVTFELWIDHVPHQLTLARRHGFEQQRDLGRMQSR
jgi:hypothetical protein